MTNIEQKALALENEVNVERGYAPYGSFRRDFDNTCEALCRAIEQHEAFRQEVSDVVSRSLMSIVKGCAADAAGDLSRFIIPKPDPLVEALNESGVILAGPVAKDLRAALAAAGFEIREKGQ